MDETAGMLVQKNEPLKFAGMQIGLSRPLHVEHLYVTASANNIHIDIT